MLKGLLAVALLAAAGWGGLAEADEAYIMVELEPELYEERRLVKRQVQYAEPVQAGRPQLQYAPAQTGQISPEYYAAYLQQLQAQYQEQQQPTDINQALSARGPQRFQQQPLPRRQQIPEDVRRLQESLNQRRLREQEREDQANQQLIAAGLNPSQVRRERLRQSAQRLAAQQAQENAARQALQAQEQHYQQLYVQQQPQLVPVPQEIPVQQPAESTPAPERVSYSQVAFGTTKLPQQRLIPGKTQQFVYTRPQVQASQPVAFRQPENPQPQPQQQVVYQPQYVYSTLPQAERAARPQQVVYTQQESPKSRPQFIYTHQPVRAQADSYQPQRPQAAAYRPQQPQTDTYQPQRPQAAFQHQAVTFQPQAVTFQPHAVLEGAYQPERAVTYQPQAVQYAQAEVTQKQTPDQYLIETTKPQQPQQQVLAIPKRQQLTYRPEPDYQELQAALIARQQQIHHARQQAEAAVSTTPAPRSAIFVTTAGTSAAPKAYSIPEEYRSSPEQRPLTQNELNALINAGFSVSHGEQEYSGQEYLRGLAKRQNARPKIGKVALSEEEREMLAKNGIRSLYRVQSAETQDSPVTYVLAVENQKRDTDKSTSS